MPCRVRSTPASSPSATGDAARKRLPRRRKVAPVHATTNRMSGHGQTNGQQCQSNVDRHAANVGVKPKQLLNGPDRRRSLGTLPSCQALAEQASAPLAAHPSVAARPERNTGEHLGHPQHIHVVPLQRTPVPCRRRTRRQDLRLRPHRGFVARPLASPLRSRRADHCSKQLNSPTLTTAAPRRTRAPTPRSRPTSKACAATLRNRRTRTHAPRVLFAFRCPSPPDCDGTVA